MNLRRLLAGRDGATAIEYGLIAALIAVACVSALEALGGGSNGMWTTIKDRVVSATTPPAA